MKVLHCIADAFIVYAADVSVESSAFALYFSTTRFPARYTLL